MKETTRLFGKSNDGRDVMLVTITNQTGMTVSATNMGASLVSVLLKDKNGEMKDVVLGYDTAEEYQNQGGCLGAVLGRCANRIAGAKLMLDGKEYQLAQNNNENNCHSGPDGFHKRVWEILSVEKDRVTFGMKDHDMQQGYPGEFSADVTYILKDDGTLEIRYRITCDQDTVANMTNHVYFNLGGHDSGDILDTQLKLYAKSFTPIDDSKAIPNGTIAPVQGTPMDFTQGKRIGQDIHAAYDQLLFTGGYDHNFVLKEDKGACELFAEAYDEKTGIALEAYTDMPGVQLYTANGFKEGRNAKGGAVYHTHAGFCLETQYFPNSINQVGFPKPLLKGGDTMESVTAYRFFVR